MFFLSLGKKLVQVQQTNTTIYPRAVVASLVLAQPQHVFAMDELSYSIDSIGRLLGELICIQVLVFTFSLSDVSWYLTSIRSIS